MVPYLSNYVKLFIRNYCYNFVPKHRTTKVSDVDCFKHFLLKYKKIMVLTGAGMSTESGIPDYRSEEVGLYARSNHKPMQYQEFLKSASNRKRYWARNFLGWTRYRDFLPNSSMLQIATLNNVNCIVTQNVDGLHVKAGGKEVIELHGSLHRVICLECGDVTQRDELQKRLSERNKEDSVDIGVLKPDGDVDLNQEAVDRFELVDCLRCHGPLKPDIVFFGDNVNPSIVAQVSRKVEECDALLVLGSSLTVYSSYRIVTQAKSLNKYVFIVNIGPTRGDSLANIKLQVKIGDLFSKAFNI